MKIQNVSFEKLGGQIKLDLPVDKIKLFIQDLINNNGGSTWLRKKQLKKQQQKRQLKKLQKNASFFDFKYF